MNAEEKFQAQLATQALIDALPSHTEVWDLLRKAGLFTVGCPPAVQFQQAVAPYVRRYRSRFLDQGMSLDHVDWDLVASCFDAESDPGREAPKPQPVIAPAVVEMVDDEPTALVTKPVPQDVLQVLRQSVLEGGVLKLPPGRMERKLYEKTNEVLVALGGKWVGRKVQGHVFEEDPAPLLDTVISLGAYLRPQDMGYFPTPDGLAAQLIEMADLEPGMSVLEPSAGWGALALRAAAIVGSLDLVTVFEIMEGNVRKLRQAGFGTAQAVDFLKTKPLPVYSRVVMNPPFSRGSDIDHFMHATQFLRPDGRISAILSAGWQGNSNKKACEFRALLEESGAHVRDVPAGAFRESGTDVRTTMVAVDAENFPWNRVDRSRERARA